MKRARKEQKEYDESRLTPFEKTERENRLVEQEDVVLFILMGNVLIFTGYYLLWGDGRGILWAPLLCAGLSLVLLVFRFRRRLH